MRDLISRQAAITALSNEIVKRRLLDEMYDGCIDEFLAEEILKKLPSAQPEPHYDEWCTDCKEYDHENSCCPRWTKVIRQTRRELQDEFVMTAVDGTLWVTVDDVQKVGRVIVDEEKSKFCRRFYMDAQPEPCTGKWIRNGWAITCSECGYDMPYTVRNFCPNCGAKMNQSDKTCDCYSDGRCIGTKEIDPCSCGGNKSKCDFYENVRREGDAE